MSLATPIAQVADPKRDEFTEYVREITQYQRDEIARKVDKIAHHQRLNSTYFWACQGVTISASIGALWAWGPRNAMTDKQYFLRPMGPVIVMGITEWALLHQVRYYMMKIRLWTTIEDFDYEMKRVKAHHVKEGAMHLAWLQFVLDQVRLDKACFMNIEALQHEPQLQQPKDLRKLRF